MAGLASVMVIISILPATQSRAGWLALAVSGTYWVFYHFDLVSKLKRLYSHKKRLLLITSSSIVLILVSGFGLYHYKKDSADGRLLIWKASAKLVHDRPLSGHGFNTFQAHYAPVLANYFGSGRGNEQEEMLAGNVRWAFNEPLQYAIELGLTGMLLFVGIVGYALLCSLRTEVTPEQKQWVYAARSSLVGIIVFGLFSYPFHSPAITLLFFFSLAVISGHTRGITHRYFGVAIQVVLVLLVTAFAIYSFVRTPKLKQAYWLWDEAESLYKIKAYQGANESFEEALPVLQTNGPFMQQYGKSLYMEGRYGEALSSLEQGGQFYKDDFWYITIGDTYKALGEPVKAERYYKEASQMVPHKLYPKYLLAKLYQASGHSEVSEARARAIAQDILASEVKVMSTAVKEIRQEMQGILDKQIAPLGVKQLRNNEERREEPENSYTLRSGVPSNNGKEVQR